MIHNFACCTHTCTEMCILYIQVHLVKYEYHKKVNLFQ